MPEERDSRDEIYRLNFLYKKFGFIPYQSMQYWLTIPDFANAMLEKVRNSETIDNQVLYSTMEGIYSEKNKVKRELKKGVFNYRLANAALRRLRREMGINANLSAESRYPDTRSEGFE